MQYWWVTANEYGKHRHDWHWVYFFDKPSLDENANWGYGTIKARKSRENIAQMETGDIVVAYQATERRLYGLAVLELGGFSSLALVGGVSTPQPKDSFRLSDADRFRIRLNKPILLKEIQSLPNDTQADIGFFTDNYFDCIHYFR